MGKILNVLMIVVASMVLLSGCGQSESASKSSVEGIQKKGKLVIGTSADYPPYQWHIQEDGKDVIVGFEMDIAQKLADALGVDLEIVDMDFDGILPALQAGKVDIAVAGFTPTEERRNSVDFTQEYFKGKGSPILVKKDKVDHWTSADQIEQMSIAVQKATIQDEWLRETYPKAKIQTLPRQTDGIMALASGRADGFLVSETVAAAYLESQPDLVKSTIPTEVTSESISMAVKKGNQSLLDYLNKEIKKMIDDQTIDALMKENTKKMLESE